jgi:short-subunit dehydrogenase
VHYAGRTAVVTGAGSGIGRALAVELARRGSRLAISDIVHERVAETASLCRAEGATVRSYQVDVADRAAVQAHADEVAADFGAVHLAVNNAGVALVATVEESRWADLEWLFGVNLWGVLHGTKAFLPYLIASGDGHLVNISSIFGFVGVPSMSAYNASKFAVRGFTEALRQEMIVQRRPVSVTCVHPGGVRTDIARSARLGASVRGERARRVRRAGRLLVTTPEGAARAILRGVDRRAARVLIGPDARLLDLSVRLFGAGYQRPTALAARIGGRRYGLGG